jgi:hypothetical protein
MPLGLWKSRWEISREEWQAESRDLRRHSDELRRHSDELREECKGLRTDYDREIEETRLFNRELLIRLEKTYADMGATLDVMGEQLKLLHEEVQDSKVAVEAQTEAILRLVDRFEESDGRPPV